MELLILISSILLIIISYHIYSYYYFNSLRFMNLKDSIKSHIDNSNDLNTHIQNLRYSFVYSDYGFIPSSIDYGNSHLYDNSLYKLKRKEWTKESKSRQIHNCSLSIVKNSKSQPLKYLCKYFNIKANEETLSNFERVLNDFSAAEQGRCLLLRERQTIIDSIINHIPKPIQYFSSYRLTKKLGFEDVYLDNFHFPTYTFHYVSAGGNSSAINDIELNIENLNKLINYLSDSLSFRNSILGQRALMTSRLRENIKCRYNYECKNCGNSTHKEQNLLLEIDHIIPLSKGGMTTEDNLQTLCWKCNRTKGSKLI